MSLSPSPLPESAAPLSDSATSNNGRAANNGAANGAANAAFQYVLPDEPVVVIEPARQWVPLGLRDVWHYRELLFFLTWRDVKVRYKQTVLGVLWAILQPLSVMLISTVLFGRVGGLADKTGGIPYALFAYAGLLPWTFFANAVTNGGNSLVGNANLLTKVYFPRLLIPGAAVLGGLVDFAISGALMGGLMIWYRASISPGIGLLALPLLVVLTSLLALGVGLWLSALNVKFRDIRYALPLLIQSWWLLSPVIWPPGIVPQHYQWLLHLNPMSGLINGFRASLFGRSLPWSQIALSAVLTFAILIGAAYSFRRMEKNFADLI